LLLVFVLVLGSTGTVGAANNQFFSDIVQSGVAFSAGVCIPSVGFLIAMVPPVFLALLTFGWKRAMFVIIGLIVTQMASDYILQPRLMKKSMHISLLEIMLSLMIWGFLLGLPGTILGVPLTIALKKYIQQPYAESDPVAPEPAPRSGF